VISAPGRRSIAIDRPSERGNSDTPETTAAAEGGRLMSTCQRKRGLNKAQVSEPAANVRELRVGQLLDQLLLVKEVMRLDFRRWLDCDEKVFHDSLRLWVCLSYAQRFSLR